jgi:hypothetical protein
VSGAACLGIQYARENNSATTECLNLWKHRKQITIECAERTHSVIAPDAQPPALLLEKRRQELALAQPRSHHTMHTAYTAKQTKTLFA